LAGGAAPITSNGVVNTNPVTKLRSTLPASEGARYFHRNEPVFPEPCPMTTAIVDATGPTMVMSVSTKAFLLGKENGFLSPFGEITSRTEGVVAPKVIVNCTAVVTIAFSCRTQSCEGVLQRQKALM
jgi:hypothetical protein